MLIWVSCLLSDMQQIIISLLCLHNYCNQYTTLSTVLSSYDLICHNATYYLSPISTRPIGKSLLQNIINALTIVQKSTMTNSANELTYRADPFILNDPRIRPLPQHRINEKI